MIVESNDQESFYNWLTGFIDGEGHFGLYKNGKYSVLAQFNLKVRDDDSEMIELIEQQLGFGRIHRLYAKKYVTYSARGGSRPQIGFQVTKIEDCLKLISILDQHPLRSKKRRDYVIWREAVIEMSQNGSRRSEKLDLLMKSIKRIRNYRVEKTSQNDAVHDDDSLHNSE